MTCVQADCWVGLKNDREWVLVQLTLWEFLKWEFFENDYANYWYTHT